MLCFIGDHQFRVSLPLEPRGDQSADEVVRNKPDEDRCRQGAQAENDGKGPLVTLQTMDLERLTANEDNQDLSAKNDKLDANEKVVAVNPLEDIELVV